jgi:hypothetical protein
MEASLVELADSLGTWPEGSSVQYVLNVLHARISRIETWDVSFWQAKADAVIRGGRSGSLAANAAIYGFVDDVADTKFMLVDNHTTHRIAADFSSFTSSVDDHFEMGARISGWIGIDVASDIDLRIYTVEDPDGIQDTLLAIWGPTDTPPVSTDDPWHFSDDGLGYHGSLHRRDKQNYDTWGTLYPPGGVYSEPLVGSQFSVDAFGRGIHLTPGRYWIAAWPYSDGDVTGYGPMRLVLEPVHLISVDAILRKAVAGSVAADAIQRRATGGSFAADAVSLKAQAGSLVADAWLVAPGFAADAVMQRSQQASFMADAVIASDESSSTLGEFTLGEGTLGG